MLNIKALEKALSIIGELGKGEFTFTVGDVPITMRVLTADEENIVQTYARGDLDDEGNPTGSGLTVLERYKRMTLSHAIVQVGALDLRNEDFVTTGEMTDKGVPIRESRPTAVRKIIDGWTRTATLSLFQKYLELVTRVDIEAEKAVKFNPQDLDAEIARVEKRLATLMEEKGRVVERVGGATAVGEADKVAQEHLRNLATAAAGLPPDVPVPVSPEVEPDPETPSPQFALPPRPTPRPMAVEPPPARPVERQRVTAPVVAPPLPPTPPAMQRLPPPVAPPAGDFDEMMDSLGDSPEAIAAETARLVAMRAQARRASLDAAQQATANDEQNIIPGGPRRRSPPHREAANLQDALLDTGGSAIEAVRPAPPIGETETYRLGTTSIVERSRAPVPPNRKISVNEKGKDGLVNPRFRPPGR